MRSSFLSPLRAVVLLLFITATTAAAQTKAPVTPDDYGKWESLGGATLSDDGKWMTYGISRVNDEDELRIRSLSMDSTRVVPYGSRPAFSEDSRWLAYIIGSPPSTARGGQQQGEQQRQPTRNKLGLLNLQTGEETVIEEISSFTFSEAGNYLMMRGYAAGGGGGGAPAAGGRGPGGPGGAAGGGGSSNGSRGVDVLVRDLGTGVDTHFGNVSSASWQNDGKLLALVIDAAGNAGNGVQLYDPETGMLKTLDSGADDYTGLTWREESDDLAVLRIREDEGYEDPTHVILAFAGLSGRRMVSKKYDPTADAAFPKEMRIVDFRSLNWSEDGKSLYFGIKEWEKKPEEPERPRRGARSDSTAADEEEVTDPAGVEVWHYKDVDILPEQKVRANRTRRENYLAVWHTDTGKFVQLADELVEDVTPVFGDAFGVGTDQTPYEPDRMFGPVFDDVYLVDTATGEKTKVFERLEYFFGASTGGKYLLYLKDDQYHVYDIAKKTDTDITGGIPTSFVNTDDDHTVDQKPPYRFAGWTKDDRSILLYDKYDVWEVRPDGSKATNLTNGRNEQVVSRLQRLDREEDYIDTSKPIYLSQSGEWTKKNGYARLRSGRDPERLVFLDKSVGRLTKAEEADVYAYVVQDADDSPDYFVGGPELANARQVTETNPFQDDYAWTRSELVDFDNKDGEHLQGALFYPAGYEPGKKYPMIVYIYEIRSNVVHSYNTPSKTSPYNVAVFTSQGYFVYEPDIVYKDRNPGLSAVDCVVPAVEKVVATGMIDRERIGLVGHSWGAYQTSFIVTQTDLFAGAVAGAPLTDLISMYLSIYWNSGGTDARIFEISQGRMEVPFWEDLEAYMANSALFNINDMNTPLMVAFGDNDGAVDWHQGIELYNAARRAGKEFVMLVYAGENHSLAKKPNQLDYHKRILEWFGHYLKGEEAPKWMTDGVTFLDREKELAAGRRNGGGR